jgi:hypothetical protein
LERPSDELLPLDPIMSVDAGGRLEFIGAVTPDAPEAEPPRLPEFNVLPVVAFRLPEGDVVDPILPLPALPLLALPMEPEPIELPPAAPPMEEPPEAPPMDEPALEDEPPPEEPPPEPPPLPPPPPLWAKDEGAARAIMATVARARNFMFFIVILR